MTADNLLEKMEVIEKYDKEFFELHEKISLERKEFEHEWRKRVENSVDDEKGTICLNEEDTSILIQACKYVTPSDTELDNNDGIFVRIEEIVPYVLTSFIWTRCRNSAYHWFPAVETDPGWRRAEEPPKKCGDFVYGNFLYELFRDFFKEHSNIKTVEISVRNDPRVPDKTFVVVMGYTGEKTPGESYEIAEMGEFLSNDSREEITIGKNLWKSRPLP